MGVALTNCIYIFCFLDFELHVFEKYLQA